MTEISVDLPALHSHQRECAAAKSHQSCPTLCDPIGGSPPGSAVPGILQARTLEWVAISFSNAWKWKVKSESEVTQSCPTLSDPMNCSLPGSSIHGIFQARVLEWGAIAFSADWTTTILTYQYFPQYPLSPHSSLPTSPPLLFSALKIFSWWSESLLRESFSENTLKDNIF